MNFNLTWQLAKMRPGLCALTTFLYLVYSCVPLLSGDLMRDVFDAVSGDEQAGTGLWTLLALLLAARLGNTLVLMVWNLVNWSWVFIRNAIVQANLFSGLMARREGMAGGLTPGQVVNRLQVDVEMFTDVINEWYRLLGQGLFAGAALVIMMRIDANIALLTALPVAAVVTLVHLLNARIARFYDAHRVEAERVDSFLAEVFNAVAAIKLAGVRDSVAARYDALNEKRRRVALREHLVDQTLDSLSGSIQHLSIGLVLLTAAAAMRADEFSVGEFALFVYYLDWIMEFPRRIGRLLAQRRTTSVAGERLRDLMQAESMAPYAETHPIPFRGPLPAVEMPADPPDRLQTLRVENATYRHPGTGKGIEAVDLVVERGELIVITGRVASGKTTLLRAVLGLLDLDAGALYWNGEPVADPAAQMVPPRCAYTAQTPRLFSEPLRDNILMGREASDAELEHLLNLSVLEDDVETLEQKLDTVIGPRGVKLSGGQAQRTAAARMLARDADLLVMDDLSSALDVETEALLWQRLGAYRRERGAACLAVSNRHAALRAADRVVVLKEGRVADSGPLDELLARSEELQKIWRGEAD